MLRFKDELFTFSELRNVIVHNPRLGVMRVPIAEPRDDVINRIKFIHKSITKPKKVNSFHFEVFGARENDIINDILLKMKSNSFSQFPVFNESSHVIELINNNTISRWLSSNIEDNGYIAMENVKVKEFIPEIEFKRNYKFVSSNISLYEAYHMFIDQINKKERNLDVLFITHSGKENEKLLGLITIEDIASRI